MALANTRPSVAVSLIVPMFDEAGRIEGSLRRIAGSTLRREGVELVLVDDGSDDGTAVIAERVLTELGLTGRVVRLPGNYGKGAAVAAGVEAARGSVIAFADADLSAGPEAIEACVRRVRDEDVDVVVATRVHSASTIADDPPLTRKLAGWGFNRLVRALRLSTLADTQCGLKAFTSDAARRLFTDLTVSRFAFDVEVLLRAQRLRLRVVEQPILWSHVEASRVRTFRDGGRMVLDVLRLRLRLRLSLARISRLSLPKPCEGAVSRAEARTTGELADERYDAMARLEREHWWFRAKRDLVAEAIDRARPQRGMALDVGCGTGAMVKVLEELGFSATGTDLSARALRHAAGRSGGKTLLVADATALPVAPATMSCVTSLDVLEHLDDDAGASREIARVLQPGGIAAIVVPAYRWAWSDHDVALGHRRRYGAADLQKVVEGAGLTIDRITYFHSWLVPAAMLLRRTSLRRRAGESPEDASYVGPRVNRLLVVLTTIERAVGRRVGIPFGLSILLVARRR